MNSFPQQHSHQSESHCNDAFHESELSTTQFHTKFPAQNNCQQHNSQPRNKTKYISQIKSTSNNVNAKRIKQSHKDHSSQKHCFKRKLESDLECSKRQKTLKSVQTSQSTTENKPHELCEISSTSKLQTNMNFEKTQQLHQDLLQNYFQDQTTKQFDSITNEPVDILSKLKAQKRELYNANRKAKYQIEKAKKKREKELKNANEISPETKRNENRNRNKKQKYAENKTYREKKPPKNRDDCKTNYHNNPDLREKKIKRQSHKYHSDDHCKKQTIRAANLKLAKDSVKRGSRNKRPAKQKRNNLRMKKKYNSSEEYRVKIKRRVCAYFKLRQFVNQSISNTTGKNKNVPSKSTIHVPLNSNVTIRQQPLTQRIQQPVTQMIRKFHNSIKHGPSFVCCCCHQIWFRHSVVGIASLPNTEVRKKCVTDYVGPML